MRNGVNWRGSEFIIRFVWEQLVFIEDAVVGEYVQKVDFDCVERCCLYAVASTEQYWGRLARRSAIGRRLGIRRGGRSDAWRVLISCVLSRVRVDEINRKVEFSTAPLNFGAVFASISHMSMRTLHFLLSSRSSHSTVNLDFFLSFLLSNTSCNMLNGVVFVSPPSPTYSGIKFWKEGQNSVITRKKIIMVIVYWELVFIS